jgi:hypothetical protein
LNIRELSKTCLKLIQNCPKLSKIVQLPNTNPNSKNVGEDINEKVDEEMNIRIQKVISRNVL